MKNVSLLCLMLFTASVAVFAEHTIQLACVDTLNRDAKPEPITGMDNVDASWHEENNNHFYEIGDADYNQAFQKCITHHALGFRLEGFKAGVLAVVSKYHRVYERRRDPLALSAFENSLIRNLNNAADELIKSLPELHEKGATSRWRNAVDVLDKLLYFRTQDFYSKTSKPNLVIMRREIIQKSNDLLQSMERDSQKLHKVGFEMTSSYSVLRVRDLQQVLERIDRDDSADFYKSEPAYLLAKSWIDTLLKITKAEVQALVSKKS